MVLGEDGEHVGADFVCGVAVGGDTVCTCYNEINFPSTHERGGGTIGDALKWNMVVEELVSGESESLLARASFAGIDMFDFALLVGSTDDAEGSSVSGGCERSGVAYCEDRGVLGDESCPVFANSDVHGEVFSFDFLGFGEDGCGRFVC